MPLLAGTEKQNAPHPPHPPPPHPPKINKKKKKKKKGQTDGHVRAVLASVIRQYFVVNYTSIQMKCQGGVIFVHAPRLFYSLTRRMGYAHCSLTGNKNYSAITKLTNTM